MALSDELVALQPSGVLGMHASTLHLARHTRDSVDDVRAAIVTHTLGSSDDRSESGFGCFRG